MTVQRPVIRELTNRIEILEREVRSLRLSLVRKGMLEEKEIVQVSPPDMRQVLAELRQEGLIRDPTPEELEHAAAWDSLPEAEKRSIDEELDALHLDPLLPSVNEYQTNTRMRFVVKAYRCFIDRMKVPTPGRSCTRGCRWWSVWCQ